MSCSYIDKSAPLVSYFFIRKSLLTIVLDDSLVHLAGIFHNMYLKLEESEDDHYLNDDGWKFHIHDVNEVPILAVTTHGTSLYPGQGRDLRLDMKKVIGTIHVLHQHNFLTHLLCQNKYSTERQQNWPCSRPTHPVLR